MYIPAVGRVIGAIFRAIPCEVIVQQRCLEWGAFEAAGCTWGALAFAVLADGSYHDVDSSVLAFQIAARGAFKEGISKAGPRILEPVMKVEVITPEDHMGDVIGDLNARRGQIETFGDKPGGMKVGIAGYHVGRKFVASCLSSLSVQ